MTDYEKLKSIIDEIDKMISNHTRSSDVIFQAWRMKTERFLIRKYGKDSLEHKDFHNTYFSPLVWCGADMEQEKQEAINWCRDGLESCKAIFETYLEDLTDEVEIIPPQKAEVKLSNMDKIFIVHGHDDELRESVARIIEKQDIEAIILSEKANQGRTIIEKFEDYSDVGGAICLFTADDVGKAKTESKEKTRARQNVVLETGYFMGKLGRNRVVILADKEIEMPSDLSGVVYTNTQNWQIDLLKDLKVMGYNVDFNKLF